MVLQTIVGPRVALYHVYFKTHLLIVPQQHHDNIKNSNNYNCNNDESTKTNGNIFTTALWTNATQLSFQGSKFLGAGQMSKMH